MKIALLGSAPSSLHLAPFSDPSWQIWACSPGVYPVAARNRCDVFFELHRWEPGVIGRGDTQVPWFSPEYCQYLREFPGTVWTGEHIPEIRNSQRLPREALVGKYGPFFFTSSLSWMFAMALEAPGVTDIGLWGVDMAATEEYAEQRPGCQFFIQTAVLRGIKVHVPPESDILQPMPMYGIGEWHPMMVKATARLKELVGRRDHAQALMNQKMQEVQFLNGAIDNQNYWIKTWIGEAGLNDFKVPESVNVAPLPEIADSHVTPFRVWQAGD